MTDQIITSAISVSGVIISALLVYLGVRYTQRQAAQAQERTADTEAERVDLARLDAMAKEITRLDQRYAEADTRHIAQIRQLRRDHDSELRALRGRVDEVEQAHARARTEIRTLAEYARGLLRLLQHAGISYPPPPPGLN
jgi:Tfp pilus assembly protein PilN